MSLKRRRPPEGDPQLEHLAGLLATAISEIRDCREAAREARDFAAEIHQLTVQQRIEPDRLAAVEHDVKAARNAAEMAFAGVQSLAAIATAAEREKKAAAEAAKKAAAEQEPPAPAPEAAPAPGKPAAREKGGR